MSKVQCICFLLSTIVYEIELETSSEIECHLDQMVIGECWILTLITYLDKWKQQANYKNEPVVEKF